MLKLTAALNGAELMVSPSTSRASRNHFLALLYRPLRIEIRYLVILPAVFLVEVRWSG